MNAPQSRYIIVGVSVNNDPVSTVNDAMSAVQGAVERLLLHGYRPIGGVSMCVDGQGRPHLAQAMFIEVPAPAYDPEDRIQVVS